jgi:hypothetical protein
MNERQEIISRISEARVLNAVNNHCRTMAQIETMVPLCRTSIARILNKLTKRGDIERVRTNEIGGTFHYHFIADSMFRIPEYLNEEAPPTKRELRNPVAHNARVYTSEHIEQLIKQHPKPSRKRKWGNYGISGSTLGGAYYDY